MHYVAGHHHPQTAQQGQRRQDNEQPATGLIRRMVGLRPAASAETGAAQELSSRGFTPPATTEKNVPEAASGPLDLPSRSSPTPWRATTQPDRLRPVSEGSAPNGGRRWYDMPGLMPVRLTVALRLDQAERANGAASEQQTEPEGQREEQRVA